MEEKMMQSWEQVMQEMKERHGLIKTSGNKVIYRCKSCKDIGHTFYVNEQGYEVWRKCDCKIKDEANDMLLKAGFGVGQKNYTLQSYTASNKEQQGAKTIVSNFTKDYINNSLLLCGRPGTGKTHLGVGALKGILSLHHTPIKYIGYRELINKIKPLSMLEAERIQALEPFLNCKVLMLDDLYKGFTRTGKAITGITEADKKIIYEIIDVRYKKAHTTIITTELMPDELDVIDEAIASRIIEMCGSYRVFFKETPNYRYK